MKEITLKMVENAIKELFSEEDLQPYKDLGNGLYELPGCIISNEEGLKEYLDELRKSVQGCS